MGNTNETNKISGVDNIRVVYDSTIIPTKINGNWYDIRIRANINRRDPQLEIMVTDLDYDEIYPNKHYECSLSLDTIEPGRS